MLNNKLSVVVKTSAGLSAVQPKNNELLPREARNLLILIDGRKNIDQYRTQLDNMKMFKEVGGVDQYFQLLLDMELIELESSENSVSSIRKKREIPTLTTISTPRQTATRPEPKTSKNEESVTELSQTLLDDDLSKSSYLDGVLSDTSFRNVKDLGVLRGKISAKMATTIESYGKPEDTWGLLMKLESCESDTELLLFLRTLAKGNFGSLSKKMTNLIKSLKKAKLI